MSNHQPLSHRYLFSKLSKYSANGFTGRLNITIDTSTSWQVYFNTGALVWASGGVHPVRRWLRQLKGCHCRTTLPQGMTKEELLSCDHESGDYSALLLLMEEKEINSEQFQYIVEGVISEVLFDVVQGFSQTSQKELDQIKMYRKQGATPCEEHLFPPPWQWETNAAKQRLLLTWQSFVVAGLEQFSPNLGLSANRAELNKQKFNSLTKYFLNIEAHQKTLRDLAVESERNVLSILRTMKSYFNQNLIEFRTVPDLWSSVSNQSLESSVLSQYQYANGVSQPDHQEVSEEVTQMYLQPKHSTSNSSVTVIQTRLERSLSEEDTISEFDHSEAGIQVNVMESLVTKEVDRQLQALPSEITESLNRLDIITYALNRLPPLYAASKEGFAHQKEEAKRNYQKAIRSATQQAIKKVKQNPMLTATRILSPDEVVE